MNNDNQKEPAEEWWDEISVSQKRTLLMLENMLDNLREEQVFEARITADGRLEAKVVRRPKPQEAKSGVLRQPGPDWLGRMRN
jgi:hypothetical protein